MQVTSYHTQACLEAWLNCENLLLSLKHKKISPAHPTVRVVNECADICLTALQALRVKCKNISELALLCVGICEECAEVCDGYNDKLFKTCAAICRHCSNTVTPLALDAR